MPERLAIPSHPSLEIFDPRLQDWFRESLGAPTEIQCRAWPLIASGEHLLLSAPTGSGKTLAAFLWVIDRLITGEWPTDLTHVLYVSPLKALNSDVHRNLLMPLRQLEELFAARDHPWPPIRVLTRSGDTPQAERRRQVLRPPEIFITTPETLNLMLASAAGPAVFPHLKVVILDEIHAVAGSKRGVHLMAAVEHLTRLAGEFQRIALSATVNPPEPIARWVGGARAIGEGYEPRNVRVVRAEMEKAYEVSVGSPALKTDGPGADPMGGDYWWRLLTERIKGVIGQHRSTLVFVNNRRLCERIAALLNEGERVPIAYAHHGSLSRETRATIEQRLKQGELPAIVATASLELGIDIGSLDQVILLGTPPSVSSALQRIGRAGHGVGQVSRALIVPTHPRDFIDAAVLAHAIETANIEPLHPIRAPLDLVAQWVVARSGSETRTSDDLYEELRTVDAYRDIPRERFDDVLAMLAGESGDIRMRAYRPLVSWDRLDHSVRASRGAMKVLYLSGGTIPDRGYYALRHEESGAKIGELDEEFVWEQSPGVTFTFGAQAWRMRKITESDVLVVPGDIRSATTPFWKAEDRSRDVHFSGLIAEFLEEADRRLEGADLENWLAEWGAMEAEPAGYLARYLRLQRKLTRAPLPHRHHILAETAPIHSSDRENVQLILHLPWGGRVNRPLALALVALYEERTGIRPQAFAANDGLALFLPARESAKELLRSVPSERLEELLRRTLEGSGMFGAHFREAAARALLLPRINPGRRMPLWLSRVRAKKLFESVSKLQNFPIMVEAWRSCLQDEFDLPRLRELLQEIQDGVVGVSELEVAEPSPFAEGLVWRETNTLMYKSDATGAGASAVRPDLIEEVARTSLLRPRLPDAILKEFGEKLRRTFPGYAPRPGRELIDWVGQRLWIPYPEWNELLDAVKRDHPDGEPEGANLAERLVWVARGARGVRGVVARANLRRFAASLAGGEGGWKCVPVNGEDPGHFPARARTSAQSIEVPQSGRKAIRKSGSLDSSDEPAEQDRLPDDDGSEQSGLTSWLRTWLGFYGPASRDFIRGTFHLKTQELDSAIASLVDAEYLVEGELTESAEAAEVCDLENYERLLRIARRARRPAFETLPAAQLQPWLAHRQHLGGEGGGIEGLQDALERLIACPLPAGLLERDILPARVHDYATTFLDSTLQESDLLWLGAGKEKVKFCFEDQIEWVRDDASEAEATNGSSDETIEDAQGDEPAAGTRLSALELGARWGLPVSRLATRLWGEVWKGAIAGDSAPSLRRGVLTDFRESAKAIALSGGTRTGPRRQRWESSNPFPGAWISLASPRPPTDPVEELDRQKERVRALLNRYGLLFRDLLLHEAPAFRWSRLFRAMRLMELSGEIVAGHFFSGISGLQFIAPDALEELRRGVPQNRMYWMNAADPASLCGVPVEGLPWKLPPRRSTTHLAFLGSEPALISEQSGKKLRFLIPADSPALDGVMNFFNCMLTRAFDPVSPLVIERINGKPAPDSPYLPAFRKRFEVSAEPQRVLLWKEYS